jgi:hypothetical protein
MAIQSFVGPWPVFSFLDALNGGSALQKAVSYTKNNTNTENPHTNINASSGIRNHDRSISVFERTKTVHGLDTEATVTGMELR